MFPPQIHQESNVKIKMLKSVLGSLDGVTVVDLIEGREYDTIATDRGDRLASYHVRCGAAVLVAPVPAEAPVVLSTAAKTPCVRSKR